MMKNINSLYLFLSVIFLLSCNSKESKIITVSGEIPAEEIGKTLHHEHILVDFIGADSTGYHRWNKEEVVEKVLPYLLEIKKLGYKTIVECTPAYLGRDPELLKMLVEKSGLQIIINTGYYSAVGAKYIPEHGFTETAEQLAERWIEEAKNGIEGTGVYPGFIKIAVERASLEEINRKVVEAACITHKATGLTIMSHTGLAVPAFQELEILKNYGVHPSAFIWTHAHNERDLSKPIEAAQMGAWIGYDNFTPEKLDRFVNFALQMKKEGLLHKLLFSHDAGWYRPGEPGGGNFRGYTEIEEYLIPALEKNGLSQQDIYQIFTLNPVEAFKIQVRPVQS
ncbi:phosphotriesterase family protein [Maribellus maritimus]|uniref:phosphotriesterase family protein n=1 Tax=Maribellus maritimus TaxID=2870838 RepID=UPI001EEC00FF|nr:phosphotriesterase [Maribellus maritimus]MCG6186798.1 phosphotriesterase [Maribellus maritimus]